MRGYRKATAKGVDLQTFYLCGVDWECEIGHTTVRLYRNIKQLKASGTCWKTCGIVKLTVSAEWVKKQTLGGRSRAITDIKKFVHELPKRPLRNSDNT